MPRGGGDSTPARTSSGHHAGAGRGLARRPGGGSWRWALGGPCQRSSWSRTTRPTRTFLAENLIADRFAPLSATSGRGGRSPSSRGARPDAAVIDVGLPGMSGLDLISDDPRRRGRLALGQRDADPPHLGRGQPPRGGARHRAGRRRLRRQAVPLPRDAGPPGRADPAVTRRDVIARGDPRRPADDRPPRRGARRSVAAVLDLSAKEFALLSALARDPARVLTKGELLRDVWGYRAAARTRTVDSHASRLRRKLADARRRRAAGSSTSGASGTACSPRRREVIGTPVVAPGDQALARASTTCTARSPSSAASAPRSPRDEPRASAAGPRPDRRRGRCASPRGLAGLVRDRREARRPPGRGRTSPRSSARRPSVRGRRGRRRRRRRCSAPARAAPVAGDAGRAGAGARQPRPERAPPRGARGGASSGSAVAGGGRRSASRDDGPGRPPGDRERDLPSPGDRGPAPRGEGRGLGLAIAREIAEAPRRTAHARPGRPRRLLPPAPPAGARPSMPRGRHEVARGRGGRSPRAGPAARRAAPRGGAATRRAGAAAAGRPRAGRRGRRRSRRPAPARSCSHARPAADPGAAALPALAADDGADVVRLPADADAAAWVLGVALAPRRRRRAADAAARGPRQRGGVAVAARRRAGHRPCAPPCWPGGPGCAWRPCARCAGGGLRRGRPAGAAASPRQAWRRDRAAAVAVCCWPSPARSGCWRSSSPCGAGSGAAPAQVVVARAPLAAGPPDRRGGRGLGARDRPGPGGSRPRRVPRSTRARRSAGASRRRWPRASRSPQAALGGAPGRRPRARSPSASARSPSRCRPRAVRPRASQPGARVDVVASTGEGPAGRTRRGRGRRRGARRRGVGRRRTGSRRAGRRAPAGHVARRPCAITAALNFAREVRLLVRPPQEIGSGAGPHAVPAP